MQASIGKLIKHFQPVLTLAVETPTYNKHPLKTTNGLIADVA